MAELAIGTLLTTLASTAATVAPYAALAGTAATAYGTLAAGKSAAEIGMAEQQRASIEGANSRRAAEFEAGQLEAQGKAEQASSQREAFMLGRQKRVALSRLQAVGAGSGFTATDPTSLALADEIEEYGTLQEQMALYGGTSGRQSSELSASARRASGQAAYDSSIMAGNIARMSGEAQRKSSYMSAGGTILGGISTFGEKYGKRAPVKSTGRYAGSGPLNILTGRYD